MRYVDRDGRERHTVHVAYKEPPNASFLQCYLPDARRSVTVVFVTGPEHARTALEKSTTIACPRSAPGDGSDRYQNTATFSFDVEEEPALYDTLLPPAADGSRWLALQVAAVNASGQWESRFGANYRLVLRSR
jgi:hypothetical protein